MGQILSIIFSWFWGEGDDKKKPSEKVPPISSPRSSSYGNSSSSRPAFQKNPVTSPLGLGSCNDYSNRSYSGQINVQAHPPLSPSSCTDSKTSAASHFRPTFQTPQQLNLSSYGLSSTSGFSKVHPQLQTQQQSSSSSCIKSSTTSYPPKLEQTHQRTTVSGGLSSPRGTCHVQSKIQTHHSLLSTSSTHSTVSTAAPHQPKLESRRSLGSLSNSSINGALERVYPSLPPSLESLSNSSSADALDLLISQRLKIRVIEDEKQVSSRLSHFNRTEQKEERSIGVVVGERWTYPYSSYDEEEDEDEDEDEDIEKGKLSIAVLAEKRWIKHYSSDHKMLLVGEGDFSFSASLAVAFGSATNITATSLDSIEYLTTNYKRALSNINTLRSMGGKVMHDVDATEMASIFPFKCMCFDLVVYNFPLAGFFPSESREAEIWRHRLLVKMFLENAKKMIHGNGEIHITHKSNGFFYDWNLELLASGVGLRLIEEVPFNFRDYPGYRTKYGFGGDNNFNCNPSKTYKFGHKKPLEKPSYKFMK